MSHVIDQTPAGTVSERIPICEGEVHLLRGGQGKPLLYLHAAGGAGQLSFEEPVDPRHSFSTTSARFCTSGT